MIITDLEVLAHPTDVNECIGGTDIMAVNVNGGSGTISYQWQESPDGTPGSFVDISGETSSTFTPPSTVASITYYQAVSYTHLDVYKRQSICATSLWPRKSR